MGMGGEMRWMWGRLGRVGRVGVCGILGKGEEESVGRAMVCRFRCRLGGWW